MTEPLTLDELVEVLTVAASKATANTLVGDVMGALRDAAVHVVSERDRGARELHARVCARAQELMDARQPHQIHLLTAQDCYAVALREVTGRIAS